MKAIDILRNHIRDLEKMILVFDEYAMYKSRDESKKAIQELTQVIVELEDLQSRSCEGCKHFSTGKQPDGFSWYKCEHNFECKRCFPDNFERLEK